MSPSFVPPKHFGLLMAFLPSTLDFFVLITFLPLTVDSHCVQTYLPLTVDSSGVQTCLPLTIDFFPLLAILASRVAEILSILFFVATHFCF